VQRGSKEIAAKWARLLLHCNSSDGPLSQDGSPRFYLIKSNSELVFPQEFFQGCLPEISCALCVWFLLILLPLILSLSNLVVLIINKASLLGLLVVCWV
jgi:hypothetical protein